MRGIVDHAAALDEAAAEDAVVALVEHLPVATTSRQSSDSSAIMMTTASPRHGIEAADDGAAEAVRPGVLHRPQRRASLAAAPAAAPRCESVLPSSTTTISCGDVVQAQLQVEVLHGGGDAAFLVARGDDDGEQFGAACRGAVGRASFIAPLRNLQPVRDCLRRGAAISSRMSSSGVVGLPVRSVSSQRRYPCTTTGCRTGAVAGSACHGMCGRSGRRTTRSAAASDMAFAGPPPRLQMRGRRARPVAIWREQQRPDRAGGGVAHLMPVPSKPM